MNLHDADLKSRLVRFLGRKQMPRRFEGKPTAMDDEIAALAGVLARNAPRNTDALSAWWPIFEAKLGEICGSMWPTEKEIRDAGKATTQEAPRPDGVRFDGLDMRDIAIAARRMARGEPVGEGYLWGRLAVEMIAEGLVVRETMEAYRKAAFLNRLGSNHPTEDARQEALAKARAWEAEAKDRHEAAKQIWGQRNDQRQRREVKMPNKAAGTTKD